MSKIPETSGIFQIDKLRLDEEWLGQPELFFNWAKKLEDAKLKLEQLESELDLTFAELSEDVRTKPSRYNLDKITENAVKAAVEMSEQYQADKAAVQDQRHLVGVLRAAVQSLEHRKVALENLVKLHGQSYFASPRAPEGEDRDRLNDAAKRRVRSKGRKGE